MRDYKTAIILQASSTYPALCIDNSPLLEAKINRDIANKADCMLPAGRYEKMNIVSAASKYDITVYINDILSIRLENYYYPEYMASGITVVMGITINLLSGKNYRFEDLFQQNKDYKEFLNQIIYQIIEEYNIPLVEEFPGINGNEEFYLSRDSLIIIYQEYQLTPGYYGPLEFHIPYSEIIEIIDQNGPIARIT